MTFSQRLKEARAHAKITQPQLAERLNGLMTQQNISSLESGLSKGTEYSVQLARACGVNPIWLVMGEGAMTSGSDDDAPVFSRTAKQMTPEYNVKPGKKITGSCPVISWVKAGEMCEPDHVYNFDDAEDWRFCTVNHSDKTFVLVIVGDSMYPEYLEGTEIFVDPMVQPEHNDDVIVRNEQGKATFKRLQITSEGQYLLALNPDHPTRKINVAEGTVICGVVIYSGRKTR